MAGYLPRALNVRLLCGHKDCKYATRLGGGYMCDYLNITGHKRGTKPNEYCYKYEKGEHEHDVNHICISTKGYW